MQNITSLIQSELSEFNLELKKNIESDIPDFKSVLDYFFETKGKQIRPILGILCAKALGEFNFKQNLFLQGIELVHNATLFHDDVIDNSQTRRGKASLQQKFSNKIAILAGDYFLSVAIKTINAVGNPLIYKVFSDYIKEICEGEIEQNFSLNKILSIDEYLQKTRQKTALLFALATEGSAILSSNPDDKLINNLKIFGENFGILFQIKDDINNFKICSDKPFYNDMEEGIYTAPIIFLAEEFPQIEQLLIDKDFENVIKMLNSSDAIEKTEKLAKKYYTIAETALDILPDNQYKTTLKNLLSKL